ncbi:MAG TPA: NHLP bacteriocin export ABC transporter permease/ATPase subunit [Aggregatilineales bacterium]|nr:NHLP bacteriocin export ABC transporter permease/ATPase subunit [Aggregatilineales bacterium]
MQDNRVTDETQQEAGEWDIFLLRLRYNEGRIVKLAGNNPIFLNDSEYVWFVYTGRTDVFASRIENGVPVGARTHLFRAADKHALFGMNLLDRTIGLLVGGSEGTQLIKVSRAALEQLAQDVQFTGLVATVLDNWLGMLSSIIPVELPPKDHDVLEPGTEIALAENQVAYPRKGIVWVRHLEGGSRVAGTVNATLHGADSYFPISTQTWLQSVGDSKIQVIDTRTALNTNNLWIVLEHFHNVVLNALVVAAERVQTAEARRLDEKAQADTRQMEGAFSDLASILYPEVHLATAGPGRDPLLAACQLVGNALGIAINASAEAPKNLPTNRALLQIVTASRIRMRRVALRGEWWRADNGPLLAFQGDDKRPVALLPTSTRRYVLHDPASGAKQPVDAALAAQFDFHGVSFYRPFPDRPLTAADLVRFGLQACRGDLATLLIMGTFVGLLGIATPVAIGAMVDTIIPSAQQSVLLQLAALLLVVALATAAFQIARDIAVLRIEGKMEASLESATMDRLLNLPPTFFRQFTAGDLGLRALGLGVIRQTLSRVAVAVILSGLFSIFNIALLFFYSPPLALVALLLVVIMVAVIAVAGYSQVKYERTLVGIQGWISGVVLQFIGGIAKFRVAGAEQRAFAVWAKGFAEQRRLAYRARTIGNRLVTFDAVFPTIASMVIFWLAVSGGTHLTTGAFLAFNTAFVQVLANVIAIAAAFTAVLQVVPIYERVKPLLETLPEVDEAKSDPGELGGSIEISHVSFRYVENGPLTLSDVSLSINPNEFIAFVGPSGSGKSTILRLLLGFEIPESGAILYDGNDLSGLDVRSVRRQIGVVLQNGKVMTADIYTNIVGSSGLSIEDAWDAARMAGLEDDIKDMPMGMQTAVNEGGSTLSGGQRQRLLIARAIATKPRLIFFDEATSALDNRTQEIITHSLESLAATKVVIAHRLSTIMRADRIFVIEKGRVIQTGTYEELIGQSGLFADLAKRQLA